MVATAWLRRARWDNSMNETVDNYCERLDAGFWSEPLNAITNVAFIVACLLALYAWRQGASRSAPALLLSLWIGVIGVGSFLFHTFATRWALAADSLPILIFILVYVYLAMRDYLGLKAWISLAMVVFYIVASAVATPLLTPIAGSSAGYLTALIAMVVVAVLVRGKDGPVSNGLFVTAAVFCASIGFRMIDLPLCETVAMGTHFMWHILNAVVLYALARIYIDSRERAVAAASTPRGH